MITIQDIAAVCGVSKSTVSKALNGHRDVSPSTRERIVRTAEELGYRTSDGRRRTESLHSCTLGIVSAQGQEQEDLADDLAAGILKSFYSRAAEEGYDLLLLDGRHLRSAGMSLAAHARYRKLDGVCVIFSGSFAGDWGDRKDGTEKAWLQEFSAEQDLPMVTIGSVMPERSAVLPDHEGNRKALSAYIRSCGHERIAYIGKTDGRGTDPSRKDTRMPSEIAAQTLALLRAQDPPTCILYPEDRAAWIGIQTIRESGLDVPADVSVAGYGGIELLRCLAIRPELTTMRLDVQALGVTGAECLLEQIRHPETVMPRILLTGGILQRGETVRKL